MENNRSCWAVCPECNGIGKKRLRLKKKASLQYNLALEQFERTGRKGTAPVPPKGPLYLCANCKGSGLVPSVADPAADTENYPHVAIIGAGIGGAALAVACLHRGIPFTIYERDKSFDDRSQGYGLTLQQASKAIAGLGISSLQEGVISTIHLVHDTNGKVIGEWGMRKSRPENMRSGKEIPSKRINIHIARQSLRFALLEQLGGDQMIQWGHQLIGLKENEKGMDLSFLVDGKAKNVTADLVVGADGIRSTVRKLSMGDSAAPLRYLGCIVILGICPLAALNGYQSPLLDSATVFQTVNGHERIYIMPFSSGSVMWQLSFPMPEEEAKALSSLGAGALKEEACRRTQWHAPIPQILAATPQTHISGYPVYDRELLSPELLNKSDKVTLMGDAAHPMSPFKGQGANQALLDALALARLVSVKCGPSSQWKDIGIRKSVLTEFESGMLERTASKVKDSETAAQLLHSEVVLHDGDVPRGRGLKKNRP